MPTPPAGPQMPSFARPATAAPTGGGFKDLLTVLPAILGGMKDPRVLGAALAGLQRGQDRKRAMLETQQQKDERMQAQRAEFYGNVLTHAAQFDDEVQLHDYLAGVQPMADYYGVPLQGITVGSDKKAAKDRKLVSDAIDAAVKRHGPEILNRDDVSIQLADGRTVRMDTARRMLGGTVSDAKGQPVAVPATTKTDTPNTPEEQFYQRYATENGGKSFADLPTTKQAQARKLWAQQSGGGVNVGSFEDYLTRYAVEKQVPVDKLTTAQIEEARKRYNQSDDKPTNTGAGDYRQFLMGDKLAKEWNTASTSTREMRRQYTLMQTGLKRFRQGDKNGGSQAVLVTFQKILDPSSVVRESEYARSSAGVSMMARLEGYVDRLEKGGAGVPDAELSAMVDTAQQFLKDMNNFTQGQRQRIARTAKEFSVPPDLIFDDMPPDTGAAVAPPAPTGRFNPATGKVEPAK